MGVTRQPEMTMWTTNHVGNKTTTTNHAGNKTTTTNHGGKKKTATLLAFFLYLNNLTSTA